MAVNPFERIEKLQQGNPCELELFGCICGDPRPRVLEARLHSRFAHLRIRGEWFSLNEDLASYIEEHCNHTSDEGYLVLDAAHYQDAPFAGEPGPPPRPAIPANVKPPSGNSRRARLERYLLARGLPA